MAPYTLHVSAELAEAIHESLTGMRHGRQDDATLAAKLAEEGRALVGDEGRYSERLAEVEAILAHVTWDERHPGEPVELSGDRTLLADVVFSAVLAACERFPDLCSARVDELDLDRLDERGQVLIGLITLLREARTAG